MVYQFVSQKNIVIPKWCNNYMIEGTGKFINRPTETGGRTYDKFFIYVPASVAKDSAFPFKPGENVKIRIKGDKLIVEKASK
jgi:hypothetical protein